jgi:Zn-dependent alcohol dehydrogenase
MIAIQVTLTKNKDIKRLGIKDIIFPTEIQDYVDNIMSFCDVGVEDYFLTLVEITIKEIK